MHDSSHMDHRKEVEFFDPENPRALANLLPEPFVRQIRNLTQGPDAYLLSLADNSFDKEISRRGKETGTLEYNIRVRFWAEYTRVLAEVDCRTKMSVPYITGRKIQKEVFYQHFITDPVKLAYILRPMQGYEEQVSSILRKANEKLREVLDMPYRNPDGSINMQIVNKLLQIQESFKREELRLIYKDRGSKARGAPEESDDQEVPPPQVQKPETAAERIARAKALQAQKEVLPGQVV